MSMNDWCDQSGKTLQIRYPLKMKWDAIWMGLAHDIATRSSCCNPNRNVGCVIVDDRNERILSLGYNGVASGEKHICEYEKNKLNNTKTDNNYSCNCVHAEQNALAKLNIYDPCKKVMYITLSPCMICARLIVNSRIDVVKISSLYSDTSPILLLKDRGIEVQMCSLE